MTDETVKRLHDALAACRAIAEFTDGLDFAAYEASRLVRSAVERQLSIIGEALNRAVGADASVAEWLPELRRIIGLRNRIIHGYDGVDDEIVWDIVQNKAPVFAAQLAALLSDEGGSS